jgi:hypothetical protein
MRRKNLLSQVSRVVTGNWLGVDRVREGRGIGGTMAGTAGGVGFVCGIAMSREPRQLRAFLRGTCGKQTTSPGCVFFVLVATDTSTLRDFARCVVLLHVAPKIIEDTNEVAIKIGGHKLA